MDLSEYLHRLMAPHAVGEELLPGVRWDGASCEADLRLRFDVRGQPLHVSVTPLSPDSRYAARSARLGFGYRTEGGRNPIDPGLGKRLCETVARIAAGNEDDVVSELAREVEHEQARRVRYVRVAHLLEPAPSATHACYTLSPYVGCTIGCRYCYAQSKLDAVRRLLRLPEVAWGSWVDVRDNAPEVLAAELAAREPRPLKFCPIVSDPYQALERREELTRRCLEVIRDAAGTWPTLLLTRSALVLRDLELLRALPRAFVGVSLPTVDDEVRRHFEPRAASVQERLEVLRAMREAGVSTFAVVQPLLPGPVEALADALAAAARSVSIDVLRGEEGASGDFDDPRYADSREPDWQSERAGRLAELLDARGVPRWRGELPPELTA